MAHNPITAGPSRIVTATGTSSTPQAFPTGAFNQIMVTNAGANIGFFEFGEDATVVALAPAALANGSTPILAGEVITVTPPGGARFVAAISALGATIYFTFGNGI